MDDRERSLIRDHTIAAHHYRWAVAELKKRQGNHEDVTEFRRVIVTPARENCSRLFYAWLAEYPRA